MSGSSRRGRTIVLDEGERSQGGKVARLLRLLYRWRRPLVPMWIGVAVPIAGWVVALSITAFGWSWVIGGYAIVVAIVGLFITNGLSLRFARWYAGTIVVAAIAWSLAIGVRPLEGVLYGSWLFAALLFAGVWWWGPTARSHARVERFRRRWRSTRMAEDGAKVRSVVETPSGLKIRGELGPRQTWSTGWREDLAHDLNEPAGAVILDRDPKSGRSFNLRVLTVDVFGGPPIVHPAIASGVFDRSAAEWSPGGRSILQPVPIGRTRDDELAVLHLYAHGDAQHGALFGKTGSGKSNTLNVITAAIAACRDAVMWAADVPKGGATFRPWADVLGSLAVTEADAELQMRQLEQIIAYRAGRVAESDADKWRPTRSSPAIVYVVEEAAATFGKRPDLAELCLQLVLTGRQSGVLVLVCSQGADWESIPTRMRDNLAYVVAHNMSPGALRLAWPGAAGVVDMSLFGVPGLLYVNDGGSGQAGALSSAEGVMPARAFALYDPPTRRSVAEAYRGHRPELDAGSREAMARAGHDELVDQGDAGELLDAFRASSSRAARVRAARAQLDQASAAANAIGEPPDLPGGPVRDVFAATPAPAEPVDVEDPIRVAILAALADADGAGLSKRALAATVDTSPETVLRRLTRLRAEGRVAASGGGGSTRWHLVREAVPA